MRYYALALLLAVSGYAAPPKEYRDLMAAVWGGGGVCRHAAATLAVQAEFDGLPFRVLRYQTADPKEDHIVFMLGFEANWYVIDSLKVGDKFVGVWGQVRDHWDPDKDMLVIGSFIQRPLRRYVEDVPEATLECWTDEDLCYGQLRKKLDAGIRYAQELRKFLSLWEEKVRAYGKSLKPAE